MINVKINGKAIQVPEGTTILEAAKHGERERYPRSATTPTFPHGRRAESASSVMEGTPRMVRACCTKVNRGNERRDARPRNRQSAAAPCSSSSFRTIRDECLTCTRNNKLRAPESRRGIRTQPASATTAISSWTARSTTRTTRSCSTATSASRAAVASRYARKCRSVNAIEYQGRGGKTVIASRRPRAFSPIPRASDAVSALPIAPSARFTKRIRAARFGTSLADATLKLPPSSRSLPSVRVALGEEFGLKPGDISTKKIYAALRRIGFKYVFDTNFSADLTIMEEGTELVGRLLKGKGAIPLFHLVLPRLGRLRREELRTISCRTFRPRKARNR